MHCPLAGLEGRLTEDSPSRTVFRVHCEHDLPNWLNLRPSRKSLSALVILDTSPNFTSTISAPAIQSEEEEEGYEINILECLSLLWGLLHECKFSSDRYFFLYLGILGRKLFNLSFREKRGPSTPLAPSPPNCFCPVASQRPPP